MHGTESCQMDSLSWARGCGYSKGPFFQRQSSWDPNRPAQSVGSTSMGFLTQHLTYPTLSKMWPPPGWPGSVVTTTNLGSAVHSFPRAMPAFSCTAAFCESLLASFSSTRTMSVFSKEEAALGTSIQLPRQRAALPTRISSSESSSVIKMVNSTGKYRQREQFQQTARRGWLESMRGWGMDGTLLQKLREVLSPCDPVLCYKWVPVP